MLRIVFEREDLGRVRVAAGPDPMWELVLSLFRLRRDEGRLVYDTWRTQARRRVPASTKLLIDLVPPAGNFADFLTPTTATTTLPAGIEAIRRTSARQVVSDLNMLTKQRRAPAWFGPLANGDKRALTEVAGAAQGYFNACLTPKWDRIQSQVDLERVRLGRSMTEGGVERSLHNLHPTVRWEPPELLVDYPADRTRYLRGRGLLLIPSFFCWGRSTSFIDDYYDPVLVYPIKHELGWALPQPAKSLVALLGRTRASLLESVSNGTYTTTELARSAGTSLATVSQQTAVLREAGLVNSQRNGQVVLHSITTLGFALLTGSSFNGRA